jgi:hypothetical protein
MLSTKFQPTTWTNNQTVKLVDAIAKHTLSTLVLGLIGFTSYLTPVQAQYDKGLTELVSVPGRSLNNNLLGQHPLSDHSLQVQFVPPPPPLDLTASRGRRRGRASHCPDCKQDNLHLTALVPGDHWQSSLALTAAERPTFWFYIPYALTPSRPVEFVLQDAADNYIYKTTFTASGTSAGVVSFSLPERLAPLEMGQQYHWTFIIEDPSNSMFVQGVVQRVALSPILLNQLKTATPPERVTLYAANGIWHEALTTLAGLRRTNPQDPMLKAAWADLLHAVGLDNVMNEPILQSQFPTRT